MSDITDSTESQPMSEQSIVDEELFDAICSEEFQTLIRVDALNGIRKFHPVYVLGYAYDKIQLMRRSYCSSLCTDAGLSKQDVYRVGIYSVPNTEALANRVGIAPSVMVLAPDIELTGAVHAFVKHNHTPVLRVQHKHSTLVQLPNTDYYGGVYETVAEEDIVKQAVWTRVINTGLIVWLRTRGFRSADNAVVSLRGTHAIRRTMLPKPEPSFTQFMRKQLERLGFDRESGASLTCIAASSDSSFDFGCSAIDDFPRSSKEDSTCKTTSTRRTPMHADLKVFPTHNIVQPNY